MLRIETLPVVDECAGAAVRQHSGVIQGVGMKQGHDQQTRVVAREPLIKRCDQRQERKTLMTANGALGFSGSSRGVHECPGVLGANLSRWFARRCTLDERLVGLIARRRLHAAEM